MICSIPLIVNPRLTNKPGGRQVPRSPIDLTTSPAFTATCGMFNIPPEGIALILPVDHFCDMFRTTTNVLGNALATAAVSKWEGELAD